MNKPFAKTVCALCGQSITRHTSLVQVKDRSGEYVATCITCWRRPGYWDQMERVFDRLDDKKPA